jgi:hypothetical protein
MPKLTGEHKNRFLFRLEEQRHLMRKSMAEFLAGDVAEAVRLAIAMRILVHETASCAPC